jgi:c-di-GMP-binding flagellar brake protein YcgR
MPGRRGRFLKPINARPITCLMRPKQQRHHFRVAGEWRVICHRIANDGLLGDPFTVNTVDLSAGGMLMVTDELVYRPVKIAALLDMVEPKLVVRGTVVRAGGMNGRHLCAMRFDALDAATTFTLARFVLREMKQRGQAGEPVKAGRTDWWRSSGSDGADEDAA